APTVDAMMADRVIGKPDAPVTIYEFASLTCVHCAAFHKDTLPKLKENWLDTGKAKLVFRDFPLDGLALRAAMMARCLPPERYFPVVDILFKNQDNWSRARDPLAALSGIGRLSGLSQDAFDACMKNEELQKAVLARAFEGQQQYRIEATPSFVIQGELFRGAASYEELDRVLKKVASGS
ncbi:DsbA family protein, partial [Stella sp.]|uniref:DsbA family protein n=1 Tax=Stella sp. TaxID=2912054 RepID=UPI0035B058AE